MIAAIEKFVLGDEIYYQQYLKCGWAGCKCKGGKVEDLHGPYWYSKHKRNPGTRHVGKEIPSHVSKARIRYKKLAKKTEADAKKSRVRLKRLEGLVERGTLTPNDVTVLKNWGIE